MSIFTKLKTVIFDQVKQGVSPEKITQSIVFGIFIGCFPLIGLTTFLGFIFGYILKLNHIILQTVNYLMYPVQILLIPIYIKLISSVFEVGDVPIRPDLIVKLFVETPIEAIKIYAWVGLYSVLLWSLLTLVLNFVSIKLLLPIVIKFIRKPNSKNQLS